VTISSDGWSWWPTIYLLGLPANQETTPCSHGGKKKGGGGWKREGFQARNLSLTSQGQGDPEYFRGRNFATFLFLICEIFNQKFVGEMWLFLFRKICCSIIRISLVKFFKYHFFAGIS
jgi:hypothetical protein